MGLRAEEIDPLTGRHAGQFSAGVQPCRLYQLRAELGAADRPVDERAEVETRPPVAASAAPVTAGHRNDSN